MSLTARLAMFLRAHPYEWIDARRLAKVAGFAGWRTRVSDLRREPWSMRVENKWETVTEYDGSRYRVSWYRYVPERAVQAEAAQEQPTA